MCGSILLVLNLVQVDFRLTLPVKQTERKKTAPEIYWHDATKLYITSISKAVSPFFQTIAKQIVEEIERMIAGEEPDYSVA